METYVFENVEWDKGPSGIYFHKLCHLNIKSKYKLQQAKNRHANTSAEELEQEMDEVEIEDDASGVGTGPDVFERSFTRSQGTLHIKHCCIWCMKPKSNKKDRFAKMSKIELLPAWRRFKMHTIYIEDETLRNRLVALIDSTPDAIAAEIYYHAKVIVQWYYHTGADAVSAFFGHGKKSIMKNVLKFPSISHTLESVGTGVPITQSSIDNLRMCTIKIVYNDKKSDSLAEARVVKLNSMKKKKSFSRLPPDEDSHKLHSQRVNYVSYINLNYDKKEALPSPNNEGWATQNGSCYPVRYKDAAIPCDRSDTLRRSQVESSSSVSENDDEKEDDDECEVEEDSDQDDVEDNSEY